MAQAKATANASSTAAEAVLRATLGMHEPWMEDTDMALLLDDWDVATMAHDSDSTTAHATDSDPEVLLEFSIDQLPALTHEKPAPSAEQDKTRRRTTPGQRAAKKGTVARRKDEMRELRALLERLQTQLAVATEHRENVLALMAMDPDGEERGLLWEEVAARQYNARRMAEIENARLRLAVHEQVPQLIAKMKEGYPLEALVHEGAPYLTAAIGVLAGPVHSVPKQLRRRSSILEQEQRRQIEMLVAQLPDVFETPFFLQAQQSQQQSCQQVEVLQDGTGAGVLVRLSVVWSTPFDLEPITEVLWQDPLRTTCPIHEEVHPDHTTIFSVVNKTFSRGSHTNHSFQGRAISRKFQYENSFAIVASVVSKAETAQTMKTPSITARTVADEESTPPRFAFAGLISRGEDWQLARTVQAQPDEHRPDAAAFALNQVLWCRQIRVTAGAKSPESACSAIQVFAKQMAQHLADAAVARQQAVESALLRPTPPTSS